MTSHHDCRGEMQPGREIDEVTADLLLSQAVLAGDHNLEPVVTFVRSLRTTTLAPPAPPAPQLAAILNDGLPVAASFDPAPQPKVVARPDPPRWRRILVAGVVGLTLTGGGMSVAAAAHLLPDAVNRVVASIVEALTPFEIDGPPARLPAGEQPPAQPSGTAATTDATRSSARPSEQGGGPSGTPLSPAAPGAATGTQGSGAGPAGATTQSPTPSSGAGAPAANAGSGTTGTPGAQPTTPNVPAVETPSPSSVPGLTLPPVSPPPSTTVPITTPPTTLPRLPLP